MPTPYSSHFRDEVTSTQDVAREAGGAGPALVVAARQTAGRGRFGATWESAPRAVAASLHLALAEDRWPRDRHTLVPLAAGVAVARLYELSLKWPNDLLLGESKVGGVLVEAAGSGVTIGVGLNLWWPDPPAGRVALWQEDPGPDEYKVVGAVIGAALWKEVALGADGWGFEEYCRSCATLGRTITWGEDSLGEAMSVDRADGRLVVRQSGQTVRLSAGEVRHVRSESA